MKWILIMALAASLAAPAQAKPVEKASAPKANAAEAQSKSVNAPPPAALTAIQSNTDRIAKALEAQNARENTTAEQQQASDNLKAQQKMATATSRAVLVGSIEALITLAGVFLVGWTLYHTRRAADAAKDALAVMRQTSEDQLRPYVHVSGAEFHWDQIGCHITAFVQNSGQTPATFFEIKCDSRNYRPGDTRDFLVPADSNPLAWAALGGNCTDSARLYKAKFTKDARAALESRDPINFFVFGVVRYGDIFGNEYETEFAYFTGVVMPNQTIKMSRPNGLQRTFVLVKRADESQQG